VAIIDELLARLRAAGGDMADIEVKAARGGSPATLGPTICGLANLPGGGWIVLGLDESLGFLPVQLGDQQALRQAIASLARACTPPVIVDFVEEQQVAGQPLVVARVTECAPSAKPCRDAAGVAWIRSGDGDFRMSEVEERGFLSQRNQPHFDRLPVDGATRRDLDPYLLEQWARLVKEMDAHGLGRFSGDELLIRSGVLHGNEIPSKAGVLVLGLHPQQFFPRLVVNLLSTGPDGRLVEPTTLSGPIPAMLEASLEWARRVFRRSAVVSKDGNLRDEYEYPLEAFRELIGNALIHRDLDEWSAGKAIEVRHLPDRLVVVNPGGLYGITLDRLGLPGTTSARNARLLELCKYIRTSEGGRVIESAATGIRRILDALESSGHPEPLFQDNGLQFTAVLRARTQVDTPAELLTPSEQRLIAALGAEGSTVAQLELATDLKGPNIRKSLRALTARGLVESRGGKGRTTTYHRTAN